ncbi:WxL domain-containing protein [Agrilactobacillus fermenti]|uniref:WxL domain-containing protein n=2 Tax=Agrilactobacillus fermenti TaxID=2586909 RepID=UPI003A5C5C65
MLWSPNQIGAIPFGGESQSFGFTASATDASAPQLRTTMDNLEYNHALTETTLPPIKMSGSVSDIDSSQVSIYYAIDKDIKPSTAAANPTRQLTTVTLGENDNTARNWVPFPGPQSSKSVPVIDNQQDLRTLASESTDGHTITLYAFDNGTPNKISNIQIIHVLANVHTTLHYYDLADSNKTDLLPPKTLVGIKGKAYDLTNKTYFPNPIITANAQYDLLPRTSSDWPSSVDGTFKADLPSVWIPYRKNPGTFGFNKTPDLYFGRHAINRKQQPTYKIASEDNPLIVEDNTGNPVWKLQMQASDFKSAAANATALPVSMMQYLRNDNSVIKLSHEPQEIARYVNLEDQSTSLGNDRLTNFDNVWWSDPATKKQQVQGPEIVQPEGATLKPGKYHADVTWTLQNTID